MTTAIRGVSVMTQKQHNGKHLPGNQKLAQGLGEDVFERI
jgi:hypothetical protein